MNCLFIGKYRVFCELNVNKLIIAFSVFFAVVPDDFPFLSCTLLVNFLSDEQVIETLRIKNKRCMEN